MFLPGLALFDSGANPSACVTKAPNSGWWVRRSTTQVVDGAGQPIGFRHQLMHNREVIKTGVGADSGRTFRLQATFLNARDHVTSDKP